MNNCLVTICDPDDGLRQEWRGITNYARVVSTGAPPDPMAWDGDDAQTRMRKVKMWSCVAADVPIVLERMSKEWVGYELKVFTLTQVATRLPGELKNKQLSKDGILPT